MARDHDRRRRHDHRNRRWRGGSADGQRVIAALRLPDRPSRHAARHARCQRRGHARRPGTRPLAVLDATPLPGAPGGGVPAAVSDGLPATGTGPVPATATHAPAAAAAAVPGGVGTEIAGLLEARDLTPVAFVLSLLTAALLGAGHALTPGHGKTVMAAYLVGARGTARHAVGLGLSVTVSHTLGILVLAGIVLAAGSALPPEAFNRWAPLASALLVLGIGGWLVAGQLRAHRARRRAMTVPLRPRRTHGDAHDQAHHGTRRARSTSTPTTSTARPRASTPTAASITATCRRKTRRSPGEASRSSGWPGGSSRRRTRSSCSWPRSRAAGRPGVSCS